ncbi:hypothetical protein IC575_017307 [Cucumis melo]
MILKNTEHKIASLFFLSCSDNFFISFDFNPNSIQDKMFVIILGEQLVYNDLILRSCHAILLWFIFGLVEATTLILKIFLPMSREGLKERKFIHNQELKIGGNLE